MKFSYFKIGRLGRYWVFLHSYTGHTGRGCVLSACSYWLYWVVLSILRISILIVQDSTEGFSFSKLVVLGGTEWFLYFDIGRT